MCVSVQMVSLDVDHTVFRVATNNYLLSVSQNIYFFNLMLGIKNIRNASCDFLNRMMIYCNWICCLTNSPEPKIFRISINEKLVGVVLALKQQKISSRSSEFKLLVRLIHLSVLKHHCTWAAGVRDACRGPRRAYTGSCIIRGHLDYQTTWTGQPLSNCTNSFVLYNPTKLLQMQTLILPPLLCSVSSATVCECKHT